MAKVEVLNGKKFSLNTAKREKNDEFYTQLSDIEKEMRYYRKHFKDKTVLCNCDDPFESDFFKYFALNFNRLGLKELIATCYVDSDVANDFLKLNETKGNEGLGKNPYKAVVTQVFDKTGDGGINMEDIAELFKSGDNTLTALEGDGDFRSGECIELLEEADVVVTNPPFSLFREYVAQLVEYGKKFIIVGNMNAVTYKEVFPLIKENKMWLGVTRAGSGSMWFRIPEDTPVKKGQKIDEDGNRLQTIGNSAWFTNLEHKKRYEEIILVHRYDSEKYPKYVNYDGIEVSKVVNIPLDYSGAMGVPITFLGKYNPEQFEIIKFGKGDDGKDLRLEDGKEPYFRILIRNRHPEKSEGEN